MFKKWVWLVLVMPSLLQAGPVQLPYIERAPQAENLADRCAYLFPDGQPQEKIYAPDELDVRSCDISSWDLKNYSLDELADVLTYDSNTVFPDRGDLPAGFSPMWIMRNSRNEGLKIDRLHLKGITGAGVSVAIIDQNLLVDHREYDRNLVWYEEDSFWRDEPASVHGTAVASILAGRTLGVAPRAKLFYFAVAYQHKDGRLDAMPFVDAMGKILDLNTKLPEFAKIRVVSISRGFDMQDNGYEAFEAVRRQLEQNGVAVFTSDDVYSLSRIHAADSPDMEARYCRPAYWLNPNEYPDEYQKADEEGALLVPTDYRTTASPTDVRDYAQYATGGISWGVPYVAGLYALGVQADKKLTKEKFLLAWEQSAAEMPCVYSGKMFRAKNFVRPALLVKKIEENSGKKPEDRVRHRAWWKGPSLYGPRAGNAPRMPKGTRGLRGSGSSVGSRGVGTPRGEGVPRGEGRASGSGSSGVARSGQQTNRSTLAN